MKIQLLVYLLLLTSCVKYHYTKSGDPYSMRANNPKIYKYNKSSLRNLDKSLIDTSSIYLIDSQENKWNYSLFDKKNSRFLRFFSTGQILYVLCDTIPTLDLINDQDIGAAGYFYIEKDKIRISIIGDTNGGQIELIFGKVLSNGDIMLYEQNPRTDNQSFKKLEEDDRKTFWKKKKIPGIIAYKPNW
jgi:hypothetical protein